jgi:hypothetical protein
VNAVRVSPAWLRQQLIFVSKTVAYFARFLAGDIRGLAGAPAPSKWALMFLRSQREIILDLSPFPAKAEVWEGCVRAEAFSGVWPISFSYPLPIAERAIAATGFMCPIFPGHRYAFTNEADYISNYGNFSFALTHKKG